MKEKLENFLKSMDEKDFKLFALPMFFLTLLDLVTTYYGACILKGIEMNKAMIELSSKYGFIFASALSICENLAVSFIFFLIYEWLKKIRLGSAVTVVYFLVILFYFTILLTFNLNSIHYMLTNRELIPTSTKMTRVIYKTFNITEKNLNETIRYFETRRKDFCDLFPLEER